MKILITGGTGFLGKHVRNELEKHGCRTYDTLVNDCGQHIVLCGPKPEHIAWLPPSSQLNAEKDTSVDAWVQELRPDVILHMAAKCGGILANKNNPAGFLRDNTQMGLNIYEAARKYGVSHVYSLGSVCMYPKYCPVPFREDDIWNGAAEETNFPYGQAKRTLMMLSQTYREQHGIKGVFLVPVNMYGEHDHFDLTNSHVIPALIRKFCDAVKNGSSPVECWGSGEATREFLYAGDAARAIVKTVLGTLDIDVPINLGVGQDISIKDLAYLIKSLTEYQGEIVFNGDVSDGQPKRMLDVSRAQKLLGWTAETDLKTGLRQTIAWYRENQ
jgi:GDP-L-fucose synthase